MLAVTGSVKSTDRVHNSKYLYHHDKYRNYIYNQYDKNHNDSSGDNHDSNDHYNYCGNKGDIDNINNNESYSKDANCDYVEDNELGKDRNK